MRGIAIRSVRSQWQSQCDRRNFASIPSQILWPIWMQLQITMTAQGVDAPIWLKSIQPLPLWVCVKKRVFAWVFVVYISFRLSTYLYTSILCLTYRPHFKRDFTRLMAHMACFCNQIWCARADSRSTLTSKISSECVICVGFRWPKTTILGRFWHIWGLLYRPPFIDEGQLLTFEGAPVAIHYYHDGQIWCPIEDHGIRLSAKFRHDRFILSSCGGEKSHFLPVFLDFGI